MVNKGEIKYLQICVYDLWIESSIPFVDRRNGREFVNFRKIEYIKKYSNITCYPPLDETRKRGTTVYKASRSIVTYTVRKMI